MDGREPWTGHLTKPAQVRFGNEDGFAQRIPIRDGRTMMWWAWVALLALQHGRTAAHAQRLRSFVK